MDQEEWVQENGKCKKAQVRFFFFFQIYQEFLDPHGRYRKRKHDLVDH